MSDTPASFRASLNERLDARRLLEAIGYHLDKLRVLGTGDRAPLKAACPIHQDPRIATLMVDPARNTFKCLVAKCEGHEGGDLIHLYELWKGCPPAAAPFGIAELLGIELTADERSGALSLLAGDAATAVGEGALDLAAELAALLRRQQPDHPEGAVLLARIAEAKGQPDQAAEAFLQAARGAMAAQAVPRAMALLRAEVLRLRPDWPEALEVLAEASDASGDTTAARSARLALARRRLARGEDLGLETLDGLDDALAAEPKLLLARARRLAEAGREAEARADCIALLAGKADDDTRREAITLLRPVAGEDADARLAVARFLAQSGDPDAPAEWVAAGGLLAAARRLDEASACAQSAIEATKDAGPEAVAAAELLESAGTPSEAAGAWAAIAERALRAGGAARAAACAAKARALVPGDARFAAIALDALEAGLGGIADEAACATALELAEEAAERKDTDFRIRALRAARQAAPGRDAALLGRVAKALDDAGESDAALLELLMAARHADGDQPEAVRVGLSLAALHAKSGEKRLQRQVLEEIADYESGLAEPWEELARLDAAAGDASAAAGRHAQAARLRAKAGDAPGALEQAEAAFRLDASHASTLAEAASAADGAAELALRLLGPARECAAAGRRDEAEALLAPLLALDPPSAEALEVSAQLRADAGDKSGACELLLRIAEESPGRRESALRRAAVIDPANPKPREALLQLLLDAGEERRADADQSLAAFAREHAGAGRWKEAIARQRQLLERRPTDIDARARLARWLEQSGDAARAAEEFAKAGNGFRALGSMEEAARAAADALRLAPGLAEAMRLRLDLAIDRGVAADALAAAKPLAEALAAEDRHAEAVESAKAVADAFPSHPPALGLLAASLLAAGEKRPAAEARLRMAEAFLEASDLAEARAALAAGLEIDAWNAEMLARAAAALRAAGDAGAALDAAGRAAGLLADAGDAAGALRAIAHAAPDEPDAEAEALLALHRAKPLEALGREAEALEALRAAATKADAPLKARLLAEAARLAPGNAQLAMELGEALELAGRATDAADLLLRASEEIERIGDLDGALSAIERAASLRPDATQVRRRLSKVQQARGDARAALENLRRVIKTEGAHGKPEDLLALHNEALQLAPKDPDLRRQRGRLLASLGREREAAIDLALAAEGWLEVGIESKAEKTIAEALEADPDLRAARAARARLLEAQGKLDEALGIHFDLFRAAVAEGSIDEARKLASGVMARHPSAHAWRVRIAAVLAEEGVPELAALEYAAAARGLLEAKRPDEAKAACEAAIAARPKEIDAREVLVAACKQLRDPDGAARALEELADLFGESGQRERETEALKALSALRPDDRPILLRLADAYERGGRRAEAVEELRLLARLHADAGEHRDAAAALRRLMALAPEETHARQDYIDAAKSYLDPRELMDDMLKLADLQARRGLADQAERTLGQAILADPTLPQPRERLLALLANAGKPAEALAAGLELSELFAAMGEPRRAAEVLQGLEEQGAGDPAYLVHRARANAAVNARGRALEDFHAAAAIHRQAGDRGRRAEVLAEIISLDPQNIEVRRELVEVLRKLNEIDKAAAAQIGLAHAFLERGMPDLAEAEFRAVTILAPMNDTAWRGLIEAHLQYGKEQDLVADYLRFGELLTKLGRRAEALSHFSAVIRLDPRNIPARERYIELHLQQGEEAELVEDYLALADLLIADGRVDEGVALFSKVMSVDPSNHDARERLTETQARLRDGSPLPSVQRAPAVPRRHQRRTPPPMQVHEPALTREQEAMAETMGSPRGGAERFLLEQVDQMDHEDENEALAQVVQSYRDILDINPHNSTVRLKLADMLERMGKGQEALIELAVASETLYRKNEHSACIEVCERILKTDPANQKIRVRLKQSLNRRDAFKALESAIIFSDNILDEPRGESKP